MAETNPNGANQYTLDPRQKLCWEYYISPRSETFSNAYQSAVKAGYTDDTSKQITVCPWFLEKLRRLNMLGKAEKVLDDMLEMPVEVQKIEGYGDSKEMVVKTEPSLVKIKQDTAKFIADRLGKDEGYSLRTELSGPNGKELIPESTKEIKELTNILNAIHGGTSLSSDGTIASTLGKEVSDKE